MCWLHLKIIDPKPYVNEANYQLQIMDLEVNAETKEFA